MGVEIVKAAMVYGKSLSGNGSDEHALYRFFGESDELLYVGISIHPFARMGQHRNDKSWWGEVVKVTIERHPNRDAVEKAERDAIKSEEPRYNVVHAGKRKAKPRLWLTYTYWEPAVGGVISVHNVMPVQWTRVLLRCTSCGSSALPKEFVDHGGDDMSARATCDCGSLLIKDVPRKGNEVLPYPMIRQRGVR